jgi:hypothetical protein
MQLCSWQSFSFEIIYLRKNIFGFLTFEIQNLRTILDRETTKTKVVVVNNIYNVAFETFFFWIRLGF